MRQREERFSEIKKRASAGEIVDCSVDFDEAIFIWSHKKWGDRYFVLELNGKVIKSAKTWKTILNKLDTFIQP